LLYDHLILIHQPRTTSPAHRLFGRPSSELEVQHRFKGYETALQASGRGVDLLLLAYGDYSHNSGVAAMQRLLAQAPDLDAVFVCSDLMAMAPST
jgi:DNA-binding LacI/PurR family transcriptional regulator